MKLEKQSSFPSLSAVEKRFLDRVSKKYKENEAPGRFRSYLIAGVVILGIFLLSRWIPWWGVALALVEVAGLGLFHQYKRFARFKSRLLAKLWRDRPLVDGAESHANLPGL